jgi:hypothetical protein
MSTGKKVFVPNFSFLKSGVSLLSVKSNDPPLRWPTPWSAVAER